jgi:phosphopantetheine adenylyltransferase
MNKLSKYLLMGLLEQESKIVALYGGGFKPPTKGHFEVVKKTLTDHPEIDKFYIVVGSGLRNNISQDESTSIWEIYKKYLPNNVEIVKSQSPLSYIKKYLQDNPDNTTYAVVGTREGDENDIKDFTQRKEFFEKYSNKVQVLNIITSKGISGTSARKAAMSSKEDFLNFLPDGLTEDEQDIIFEYVKSVIQEEVTQSELNDIEKIADEWFEDYGIDVVFTKHFIERVNDERNGKPISSEELEDLFTQTAEKYGEKLANLPDDYQAVLFKLRNDINLPFALNYDEKNDEMDLVAKTVMRKRNFQTSNPKLTLQEIYSEPSEYDYPKLIKSFTKYMLDKGMNIKPLPKLRFIKDDIENANNFFGKTAYYDPNQRLIVLYTMSRHPKDVMRSFAHEMIHHIQNCEGRLNNIQTQDTNEDGDLPEIEREAYEKGNMTFRNWTDTLTESIISEGRYDKTSNTVSSNIFNHWKNDFKSGKKQSILKLTIEDSDVNFDLIAKIKFTNEGEELKVDGGLKETKDGDYIIVVDFEVDKNILPKMWSEISMNLKDVIRHEIEHITQFDPEIYPSKFMDSDQLIRNLINAKMLPKSQYFKLEKEVDANLQGMYFRAKKEKRPFKDVINSYLDSQNISPKEKEEILNIWRSRISLLNLPKF